MESSPERSIATLAERERGALVAFARRRLGARCDEAEDAVQDALLKALRALQRGARPEDPRAWLFTIVAHCCADAHAAAARRPTQPIVEGVELRDDAPSVARTVEARAEVAATVRSIAALPEAQRRALVGYELGGDSYDELGARHGWSVSATKSLLWRARAKLLEERTGWAQIGGAPLVALRALLGHAERPVALLAAPWGAEAIGCATAVVLGASLVGLPAIARPAHPHASQPAAARLGENATPRTAAAPPATAVRATGRTARVAAVAPSRSSDPASVRATCAAGVPLEGHFTAPALLRARRALGADAAEYSGCAEAIARTLARGT